jgi:hypothetical protein
MLRPSVVCVGFLLLFARPGFGQTDEIQVYDAGIAEPGQFNLTVHSNFTPSGATSPGFPGAVVANKSFNGVPKWAYGVTDWFEAGLYLPLYSIGTTGTNGTSAMLDGMKLRALFVTPHADERRFFYGANFEFSLNAKHWDTSRFSSEVRPIVGWHLHAIDVIFNPIVDTAYDGLSNLDFAPAMRFAYNTTPAWALAVEEYSDFGPVHHFRPIDDESHQLWGVIDHHTETFNIEAGIGFGLTSSSDHVTLKLILSRDLNKPRSGSQQKSPP